jgi:hypothetical protein
LKKSGGGGVSVDGSTAGLAAAAGVEGASAIDPARATTTAADIVSRLTSVVAEMDRFMVGLLC